MTDDKMDFYVSLEGNDAWSGRLPAPNADRTDGPLRSLPAAQAAVCREKAGRKEPAEIRVGIRGGIHELTEPLLFTAQDSGFPRKEAGWAQTWPVVWAAYPGETPVISGGRRITSAWRPEPVNGREAWVTEIPEVASGQWLFRQLWVNGQRRQRPRLPKQGVWQVERALDACYVGSYGDTMRQGARRFGYAPGQIQSDWRNLRDIEVQFFGWWVAPRARLTEVDDAARVAWFDRYSTIRLAWAEGDGVDYRLENVFEALTEPGEWYLDRPTGKLTYIPMPGEDMAAAEVVAPRLEALVRLDGAANLRFEGLTFAHTEWREPEHFADSSQASNEVPGAVILHRTDSCLFRDCRVLHTNTYGVEMLHGTIEARLDHCELRDLGAGGVKIWHGCRRNVVSDCEIADSGHVYPAGVGVLIGKSTGNRIEHNHIHDLFYSGISAGWNWGYGESDGYGNLIEWNHIHDIGKGLLSDMGGIYLLGHAAGTRLRYNHIHDITCRRYGGWCIYTDEGSSDVLIESNLCYRANKDPFHQHYGRNNQVRNNIFAYGGDAVLAYSKQEPHLGLVFESNILLSGRTPILRGAAAERWTPRQAVFRRNLYWCEAGPVAFGRGAIAWWGSQPFPNGYKAEASRFAALGELPTVAGSPGEADWSRAKTLTRFVARSGAPDTPPGVAELRLLRQRGALHVRGVFRRPPLCARIADRLWNREHMELFLKPFAERPGMAQIGLASDGETAVVWHDGGESTHSPARGEPGRELPGLETSVSELADGSGWRAELRIPLAAIAAATGGTGMPAWSFLAGFAMLPEADGWDMWQALGHDPEGVVVDPLFVDPQHGDFRLRPESPARALGFVPFDSSDIGPRKDSQR